MTPAAVTYAKPPRGWPKIGSIALGVMSRRSACPAIAVWCGRQSLLGPVFLRAPGCSEQYADLFLFYLPIEEQMDVAMKWILVVLIGGMTPIQTDLQFEKLSDCLSAEEHLRTTYADAYEARERMAAANIERRRDYRKARNFQERRLANTGTCIPHAGTDQPVAVTKSGEQPSGLRLCRAPHADYRSIVINQI